MPRRIPRPCGGPCRSTGPRNRPGPPGATRTDPDRPGPTRTAAGCTGPRSPGRRDHRAG